MKKILATLLMIFLTACSKPTFQGNTYVLTTSPKNLPITLSFSDTDNKFSGKAVNNYFGTYTLNGQQITFSQIGSTMMMGEPSQMTAETTYFQELAQVRSFRIANNYLVLILENKKELLFEKE